MGRGGEERKEGERGEWRGGVRGWWLSGIHKERAKIFRFFSKEEENRTVITSRDILINCNGPVSDNSMEDGTEYVNTSTYDYIHLWI